MTDADLQHIGDYQIIEQIGSGGMATVYRAYHAKLDRDVAIKVIHKNLAQDTNYLARFEREARIIARLDHPNIVPLYDYDEFDGQPYLVMKHIDGQTLKEILSKGTLTLDQIREVMREAAAALGYAHHQGVLHRDIKPSNIIIDDRGTPYLTDFGLARIARQGESTMSADTMLGTPHYISPEQAQGLKDIDARADVYSLGVVLYELVVGRVPFMADSAYAIVHKQIYAAPPAPSQLNPEVPPAVERVLLKALEKNPADRYDSPEALMHAFDAAVERSGLTKLDDERQSIASQIAPQIQDQTPGGGQYRGGKIVSIPVAGRDREFAPPSTFMDQIAARFREIAQQISQQDWVRNMSATVRDRAEEIRIAAEEAGQRESSSPTRALVKVDEEYGTDEESIRRRVNRRLEARRNFFARLFVYMGIVAFMAVVAQPGLETGINQAIIEPDVIQAFNDVGGDFLSPLLALNLALIVALLGAGGVVNSGLRVFYDSGWRLERKRGRIENELADAYGPYWQETAGEGAYRRARRRMERASMRVRGFIGHFFSAIFLTLAVVLAWPPIKESLAVFAMDAPDFMNILTLPVPLLFGLLMLLSLVIHGIAAGLGSLFETEPRELMIARELEREMQLSAISSGLAEKEKRKHTLDDLLEEDDYLVENVVYEGRNGPSNIMDNNDN